MITDDQQPFLHRTQQDPECLKKTPEFGIGKLAIASLLLACFLANADESFILTTGSDVASALGAPESTSWLITAYNLGYTTALPLYGQICDLTGPKKAILLALVLYGSGCIMTGLAGTIQLAIVGRVVSGLGGSGMVELVSVLVNEMGSFHRVAVLRSYVTTVSVLGVTCGAPLGAVLTNQFGWQWAFLMHIPFAVLCITVISMTLVIPEPQPHVAPEHTYGTINGKKKPKAEGKPKSFDIAGLVLIIAAILCFLALIQVIPMQGMDKKTSILLIFGGSFSICLSAFLINEEYLASDPLIPLYLLSPQNLGLIYACQVFIGLANSSMIPILSDYWVSTRGFSPQEGALCWAPATVGMAAGSVLTGQLIQRSHKYLLYTKIGIMTSCSSFLLILVRWTIYEPSPWEILYTFPAWVGMGMILSSQFSALSAMKPEQNAATSVTTYYLLQQIGFMTGVTTSIAVMERTVRNCLTSALGETIADRDLINDILSSRQSLPLVPIDLQDTVRAILRHGYSVPPAIATASLLAALYLVYKQKEIRTT